MTGQKRQQITIGGKQHACCFSYNMLCMVETQGGTREFFSDDVKAKNLSACRAILWAAINASRTETVTIEEAGDLCEQYIEEHGGIPALVEKISGMMRAANLSGSDAKNPETAASPAATGPELSKS